VSASFTLRFRLPGGHRAGIQIPTTLNGREIIASSIVENEAQSGSAGRAAVRSRTGPPRWKFAILVWLAIYPALTLLLWIAGPEIRSWPLPLRTLALTVILVPSMVYVLLPALQRLLAWWLRPS
jgi:antibiotic biosynthesis monooxygenase (ABM) superfamily enzyme